MPRILTHALIISALAIAPHANATELVIGEETIKPGITFIFEGAPKDTIYPKHAHLAEKQTDVHLEARANWAKNNTPNGTPAKGFVAYLNITAEIINEKTRRALLVNLTPHINLIDNLHYARNIALPGQKNDRYTVIFRIQPSEKLSLHADWVKKYGRSILKPKNFTYKNVGFEEIANAAR